MLGVMEFRGQLYVTISGEMDAAYNKKVDEELIPMLRSIGYTVKIKVEGDEGDEEIEFDRYNGRVLVNHSTRWRTNNYPDTEGKTIYYVHNKRYMNSPRFIPFKRYKKPRQITCNNGSTCVESKLFSYARAPTYTIGGHMPEKINKIADIDGFAAFWVGDKSLKKQYMKEYNFWANTHPTGGDTFIRRVIFNQLDMPDELSMDEKHDIIRYLALPCPGCQMNFDNYDRGTLKVWDASDCYPKPSSADDSIGQFNIGEAGSLNMTMDEPNDDTEGLLSHIRLPNSANIINISPAFNLRPRPAHED